MNAPRRKPIHRIDVMGNPQDGAGIPHEGAGLVPYRKVGRKEGRTGTPEA
jgi:hypothetical protein